MSKADFIEQMKRTSKRFSNPIHEIIEFPRPTSEPIHHVQTYPSPSRWQIILESIRAPLAEFLGVAVFVLMGTASQCQAALSSNQNVSPMPKGSYLSLNFGWAAGAALGVWITAGISGAHINPAMTIALATWKGFPWRKVPIYIFAQVSGGIVGAAITYGQYLQAINIFEGGHNIRTQATAGLFATFPLDYMTALTCYTSEFLGTFILAFMIIAALDKQNAAPDLGLLPVAVFIIVLGLGVSMGMQTFAFNPAHDLGCRLLLTMAGYGYDVLYSYHGLYWLYGPIFGPITGALAAVGLYELVLRQPNVTVTHPVPKDIEKSTL